MSSSLSEIFEPNVYCDFHGRSSFSLREQPKSRGHYTQFALSWGIFVTIHIQFAN